ncbi:ABC family plasma membrane transporter [Nucleospora cyclopteri]
MSFKNDQKIIKTLFEGPQKAQSVTIQWSRLFLKEKNTFLVVDSDGICQSGEMTCLIGPKYSGKKSIELVLTGNYSSDFSVLKGQLVKYNGQLAKTLDYSFITYITDLNMYISDLTVKEYMKLLYSLNNDFSVDIREYYKDLLVELKDFPIEKLAIGHRFLLRIVEAEILQRPVIIVAPFNFSPEVLAEGFKQLKRITLTYKMTVLTSCHTASSKFIHFFDKLILISKGNTIYQGPVNNIKKYFAEKYIKYSNEKQLALHFDENESTAGIVNKVLSFDKTSYKTLSDDFARISYFSEEYFKHKTFCDVNPYLNTTVNTCNTELVTNCKKYSLKMWIFYLSYICRKQFNIVQITFNILLPEAFFYLLTVVFINLKKDFKIIDYFVTGFSTDQELIKNINIVPIFYYKSFIDNSYIPSTRVLDLNHIMYPFYMLYIYPIFLLRSFLLEGFYINLSTVRGFFTGVETKQSLHKVISFIKCYFICQLPAIFLNCLNNSLVTMMLFGFFNFKLIINVIIYTFLTKPLSFLLFLSIYRLFLYLRNYKAITINITLFLIKSMIVLTTLYMYKTDINNFLTYHSIKCKSLFRDLILYNIFSPYMSQVVSSFAILLSLNLIFIFINVKV